MKWERIKVGRFEYKISENGDVVRLFCLISNGKAISLRKPIVLKGTITRKGYRSVELDGKAHQVHRLVAKCFLHNEDNKPQVNHKDGNKLNNSVGNLEWCTNEENMRHAYKNGLKFNPFGEHSKNFKYKFVCVEYREWGELMALDMANKINKIITPVKNLKSCASNIRHRLKYYGLNFIKSKGKVGE